MRNWSDYTPDLSSWINAFLLGGLLIIATSLIPSFYNLWSVVVFIFGWLFYLLVFFFSSIIAIVPYFIQILIQFIISGIINFLTAIITPLVSLISPLMLLSPIPIFAFAHHYLYLLLDRYYPDFSPLQRGRVTGYLPGIASWWYGLYGLLVIILGMLISDAVLSIVPWINFNSINSNFPSISELETLATNHISFWVRIALMIFVRPIYSPFMRLLIWVLTAAYLYQFEFKVRQHFVNSALRSRESDR